jgi:threonine/homoserine/homoserine lactone efflux protein
VRLSVAVDRAQESLQLGQPLHDNDHHVRVCAGYVMALDDFGSSSQLLQQRLLSGLRSGDADDGLDGIAGPACIDIRRDGTHDPADAASVFRGARPSTCRASINRQAVSSNDGGLLFLAIVPAREKNHYVKRNLQENLTSFETVLSTESLDLDLAHRMVVRVSRAGKLDTTAFIQGLGIGFAIAAPVGPIGMLCIRRTLHSGAATGLASGLGAAVADALYGLAVASGLAFTGWLVSHSGALALVGSALLVWMGVGTLRVFRARASAERSESAQVAPMQITKRSAFASTFALTATNPATLVGFIAVIAALGSASSTSSGAFLLVLGVFLGSMLWWTTLVALVRAASRIVSMAWFRWLDLVTGLVLLGTGLWIGAGVLL